ncbi:hypothetical protein BHE74_00047743 [Ensete ventricosum]|uniref:Uncharacterized protein n=1 Tax=Ensete ventricosum TaxID=4639 RepID=A0A426YC68_ENSVE|nr:hypothetical protein B296_00022165 [Ensete ventricosum]RWW11605.1 hypothetical protein GW17_00024774 [Ensete ventricosum]RWW46329.1 hypothetical protein BHE74_00047743 [Ensete ventricosum]RZS15972.1 hypothetical protein BHM03_00047912 [Ensete ventricosum]
MQKTKRSPKVEVGTKTTDADMDEWLQVNINLLQSEDVYLCFGFGYSFTILHNDTCVFFVQGTAYAQSLSKSKKKK